MSFVIVVDFFSSSYYFFVPVISFLIPNGNVYTHKKFPIVVTEKVYTREIQFCGCINQHMQNLVPAKICTSESVLRAEKVAYFLTVYIAFSVCKQNFTAQ